jgi:integrase/recombinase XerD
MTQRKIPMVITEEQALKLFSLTFNPHHRLQMQLMWYCGLRVSEMLALRLQDIDLKTGFLTVRQGKGGKDRILFMVKPLQQAIKEYLAVFPRQDTLFSNTRRNVQYFVERAGVRIGMQGLHPHTFRHGFGTKMFNKLQDTKTVANLMGHENVATTNIYAHMDIDTIKNVMEAAFK